MKILLGTLLMLFLTNQALILGSVWDSHIYPIKDAVIEIEGSDPIKGQMSLNWDGSIDLQTNDGLFITLPQKNYSKKSFIVDKTDRILWRSWMPFLLIVLAYIFWLGRLLYKRDPT